MVDSSSDEDNAVPSEKRPRGASEDPPQRLSGNFSKHKLGKIVGGGQGNVGSVLCTRSGVKQDIFVSSVLCCFTNEAALKNITP